MKVTFKTAVCFHGVDYKKGTHDVPEKVLQHKFFHKLVLAGLIVEGEAKTIKVEAESLHKRNEKLAEKLQATAKAKAAAKEVTPPPPPPPEELEMNVRSAPQTLPEDEDQSAPVEPEEESQEAEEVESEEKDVKSGKSKTKRKR